MAGNPNEKVSRANHGLTVASENGPDWSGEVRFMPDRLDKPIHWRKPRKIFVNALSDLFHQDVPMETVAKICAVMCASDWHIFQILTKRPQLMARVLNDSVFHDLVYREVHDVHGTHMFAGFPGPMHWWGTSIESDRYCFRANYLRQADVKVRWLSLEPLLGPLPSLDLVGIDWLVIGGESGSGARPMDLGWVREIMAMAGDAGVPVFVKQLGAVWARSVGSKDRHGGDIDEFPEEFQVRRWPNLSWPGSGAVL